MKRVVLFVLVVATTFGVAQAAQLDLNPNPPTASHGGANALLLPNITQSADMVPVTGSIACTGGGIASDNHFLRRYFLNADHAIALQYNVTSVDVAFESVTYVTGGTGGANFTLNVYSINNGSAFTFANMSLLDSTMMSVADGTALALVNFAVGGSIVDPVAQDLVVSLFNEDVTGNGDGTTGDGSGQYYMYWPGSNASGQTQPGYLASVGCGITDPTDIAAIGFPNMHLIQTVYGDEAVIPTPTTPSGAQNPVPTMNRYGVIAMVVLLLGLAVLVISRRS